MRPAILLAAAVMLLGCTREPAEVSASVAALEQRETQLKQSVQYLVDQESKIGGHVAELRESETVLAAIKDGKAVQYLLKVNIRQIHYSLSLKKQFADMVNEEEFEIATDRDTYDRSQIGQDLFDSFRIGSAIMKGSLGSWRLKIVGKRAVTS